MGSHSTGLAARDEQGDFCTFLLIMIKTWPAGWGHTPQDLQHVMSKVISVLFF